MKFLKTMLGEWLFGWLILTDGLIRILTLGLWCTNIAGYVIRELRLSRLASSGK